MRTRKIACLYGLFLVSVQVMAQQPQPPFCDCWRVADDLQKKKFYSETQAQAVIDTLCHLFRHPAKIYPKPYACENAIYSMVCEADEKKYVFYNHLFMGDLLNKARWGDKFLLAHEIAHHLLGHTEGAYRLGKLLKKENDPFQKMYPRQGKGRTRNDYTISIPRRHLHELEADALGLWMLLNSKRKATRSDMQEIFRVLPNLLSVYGRAVDPGTATDSHPSLFIRQRLIERYWEKYENPDFNKRIAAIDEEGNHKALEDDTEEFYAFQLLSADKEQQAQFNQTELSIRDSLSRRSRFFVDVILGGMMQRPVLHRDGESVAATDSRSLTGGLRVGVGPWYRPHRFETDLKVGASKFTTQAVLADGLRTTEQFRTTYLYVQPRYVYSHINRLARYAYRASGWMATLGLSVSVPLRYDYINYTAAAYQAVPQRATLAPVVGVGYGLSNWVSSNGHFRLWLLYQPQSLGLATEPSEKVSAWMHTVSLDFSFRFW